MLFMQSRVQDVVLFFCVCIVQIYKFFSIERIRTVTHYGYYLIIRGTHKYIKLLKI